MAEKKNDIIARMLAVGALTYIGDPALPSNRAVYAAELHRSLLPTLELMAKDNDPESNEGIEVFCKIILESNDYDTKEKLRAHALLSKMWGVAS